MYRPVAETNCTHIKPIPSVQKIIKVGWSCYLALQKQSDNFNNRRVDSNSNE